MTTNFELMRLCRNIKDFTGVFMIDELRNKKKPMKEKAIVNLADSSSNGTHWCAFKRNGRKVQYFDSFGDLRPKTALLDYFGKKAKISYNKRRYQAFDKKTCGILCVRFLKNKL